MSDKHPINTIISFIVDQTEAQRLDSYIATAIESHPDATELSISRERIKQLITEGYVQVNQKKINKASYKVSSGETLILTIPEPEPLDLQAENLPIEIIFEDEHCLVVNKPRGMLTHPTPSEITGTLVNALLYHCEGKLSEINGIIRPGIVHRLDRDTSGLLMVAKTNQAHQHLAEQIKEKSAKREYQAVVQTSRNSPPTESGSVNAPIGRNPKQREKMCVIDSGRDSVTHWHITENAGTQYKLIHCILETGRTHQIRVHLSHIGYPIVGDILYGTGLEKIKKYANKGQCLQAVKLSFTHPANQQLMNFEIPLDKYMQTVWEKLCEEAGSSA